MQIIFNAVSKNYVFVANHDADSLIHKIENPNAISPHICEQLTKAGFVVADDVDELETFIQNRKKVIEALEYELMIYTTFDCNYDCWYCIQKHTPTYLSDDTIQKIKNNISLYCVQNSIRDFHLSWFGGEPLMNISAIQTIGGYAQKFCNDNGISFSTSITTNAFLLNDKVIEILKEQNCTSFQITLDGSRDVHNKVKVDRYTHESAFDTSLSNVSKLVDIMPNTNVVLRFNYTHSNIDSLPLMVEQMNELIPRHKRNHIEINFQKVWQEDESQIDYNAIFHVKLQLNESGYRVSTVDMSNYYSCYVELKHFNAVYPDGSITKCSNTEKPIKLGEFNSDGAIIWNSEVPNYTDIKPKCKHCKHLPLCLGSCPKARGEDCVSAERTINQTIREYCENVYLNHKLINA